MAEEPLSGLSDDEKRLKCIAENNCAEILRKVIEYKVGSRQCPLFCKEISEKCKTFSEDQERLLRQGHICKFDITLCVKVVRNIDGIKPSKEKWNSKITDSDHSLFSSLKRIFQFLKDVIYSPDDADSSPEELIRLVSTAFKDTYRELFGFERDFYTELNSTRPVPKPDRPPVNRLSSQVVTDATIESSERTDSESQVVTGATIETTKRTDGESEVDSDIDLETEYSFLHLFSPEERVEAKRKIPLIQKYKDRFPPDLKAPQSDVMMVCSQEDRGAAKTFLQSIDSLILDLENGRRVKVKTVFYDDARFEGTGLGSLQKAYERSTYAFLYVTKSFVGDDFKKLVAESLLMDSITDETKKWRVVPLHTSPRENRQYKEPFGINALKSLNVFQQDEFYCDMIRSLLGNKIHEREKREFDRFEKEYQEALRIQQLSLQDTQTQRNLPVEVVRPMKNFEDSQSAPNDERTKAQASS
ncbi:uncharacterized protein LOC117336055 [Pecten maximus]|uniref:uncharacterized protein LOC117336055 n=1 Tax=Pecten maximus TaxID=6579 RepID=UPI001458A704|nr:uncharacterized protein LOC117336055 [Pecten maximus]